MSLWPVLITAFPSVLMASLGLGGLAMLTFAARPDSGQVGVIVAPWADAGMARAAAFDAPIIALRWGGHLIVLDISQNPTAFARLKNAGAIMIETGINAGCTLPPKENVDA